MAEGRFRVWQGTEGDWKWSLESTHGQLCSGPYSGHSSYSGAAEEVSRIAVAAQEAADYWLRLHPS